MSASYIYHYHATGMKNGVESHLSCGFISMLRPINSAKDYDTLSESLRIDINKNSKVNYLIGEVYVKSFSLVSVNHFDN